MVELVPGRYEFWVHPGPRTVGGNREITIRGPSTLEFDPDTDEHRWGGALLSMVGVGAFAVAIVLIKDCFPNCNTEADEGHDETGPLPGPLALAGLIAMPIGFTMLATSVQPEFKIEDDDPERLRARPTRGTRYVRLRAPPRPPPPRVHVAAAPSPTGAMVGFGISF